VPTTSSRRFSLALVAGAVLALSALAVPTAASAATACIPDVTPTAQTQPWADFASSPNQFVLLEASYLALLGAEQTFASSIQVGTTQVEYDALSVTAGGITTTAQADAMAANNAISASLTALSDALLLADPAHQVANQALIDGLGADTQTSQYGDSLNTLFTDYLTGIGTYLASVQTAILAMTPVPVEPTALTDNYTALIAAVDGFGAYAGNAYYGQASTYVIFACPTALAATGSGDPTPAVGGAAVVLLAGGILVLVARRRAGATA
jgi:LPXTG-motif cell wall-anchored protein